MVGASPIAPGESENRVLFLQYHGLVCLVLIPAPPSREKHSSRNGRWSPASKNPECGASESFTFSPAFLEEGQDCRFLRTQVA